MAFNTSRKNTSGKRTSIPAIGLFISLMIVCVVAWTFPARAVLEIEINQGIVEPLPIAIMKFGEGSNYGEGISDVITLNLERTGLFRPINRRSFIEVGLTPKSVPNFIDWRIINAQALVTGDVVQLEGGRLQADFRLWDVNAGEELAGQQFATSQENWRGLAHGISDTIYEKLTGEQGYFSTKIVYIEETGPKRSRVKRLAIMDQDGANNRYLTAGRDLVLTPRFSPDSKEVAYMSYEGRSVPKVYLLNIESGRQRVVGNFPGMTFAPRFSPNGQDIVMSLQDGGNANIYSMNLSTGQTNRLTNSASINTSPSYSPDGSRIVFESDRGGSQQLYVMSSLGGNAVRISFGQGRYATPVWSPRGDMIAFTKLHAGRFMIGVMAPDGSGERILTEGFHNEGPAWSPNGRVLIFFRDIPGENGGPQLWSVDLTGYNEQRIETQGFASDPAWSPLVN